MVMHECDRVDLSFIDTAPFRFVSTVDLAITPEQLFEVLADAESWPHWATAITKVTWTSPEPRGVGTTRTVNMRGGIVGDEVFLAWEPFTPHGLSVQRVFQRQHLGFRRGLSRGADGGGCHLTWVMAMKPKGIAGRIGMTLGRPVMGRTFQKFLHNLREYTDKRYSTA